MIPILLKMKQKKEEAVAPVEPVLKKKDVKQTAKKVPESEAEDAVVEKESAKGVFLDMDDLAKIASKTSGNLTAAEIVKQDQIIKKKANCRTIKREEATADITGFKDKETTTAASILPAKRKNERSKPKACSSL